MCFWSLPITHARPGAASKPNLHPMDGSILAGLPGKGRARCQRPWASAAGIPVRHRGLGRHGPPLPSVVPAATGLRQSGAGAAQLCTELEVCRELCAKRGLALVFSLWLRLSSCSPEHHGFAPESPVSTLWPGEHMAVARPGDVCRALAESPTRGQGRPASPGSRPAPDGGSAQAHGTSGRVCSGPSTPAWGPRVTQPQASAESKWDGPVPAGTECRIACFQYHASSGSIPAQGICVPCGTQTERTSGMDTAPSVRPSPECTEHPYAPSALVPGQTTIAESEGTSVPASLPESRQSCPSLRP